MRTIAWFKHGPYEEGDEPLCVFTDPQDDDLYTPLVCRDEADRLRAENEKLRALLTRASTHVRAERLSEEIKAATSGREG